MNKMIENILEIHNNDICMFKIGGFFHCFAKDAEVMSYIFRYKIKNIESIDKKEVGFPADTLPKVKRKLEDKKINYIVIDSRNNYDVNEKTNFKDLNMYEEYQKKSKVYVNLNRRIDNINNYLHENIESENIKKIIKRMEDVIDEAGEI